LRTLTRLNSAWTRRHKHIKRIFPRKIAN